MIPAIHALGLGKRYGTTVALTDLDLDVAPGEVYGLLGPNGSGKTTAIRLLMGFHRPTSGRVEVFGHDAWREAAAVHERVAYVAADPALWPELTGAETLDLLDAVGPPADRAHRAALVERFGLDTGRRVRELSKGNRQKVQLVAAFATRAALVVLDEPTGGLDPLMEVVFRETVAEARERGQAVLLSSHILSEVEALCDRVGILRAGRLVDEGTLAGLRHLRGRRIDVTFEAPVAALPALDGVVAHRSGDRAASFDVDGQVAPLLAALGRLPVATLDAREASLEEIFLGHYGAGG